MKKITGKEIQDRFCKIGINALWIKNIGMIFMPNSYGTDTAVTGKYHVFSLSSCAELLPQISEARAAGDDDPLQLWLHGRETNRTYKIR